MKYYDRVRLIHDSKYCKENFKELEEELQKYIAVAKEYDEHKTK